MKTQIEFRIFILKEGSWKNDWDGEQTTGSIMQDWGMSFASEEEAFRFIENSKCNPHDQITIQKIFTVK